MRDLAEDIVAFIESGIQPVSIGDVTTRFDPGISTQRWNRPKILAGGLVGLVAIAAALVVALVVLPVGTPGGPASAAAAELDMLSVQATNSEPTTLSQGQYYYTDIATATQSGIFGTQGTPAVRYYFDGNQQTWIDEHGAGRMVVTSDPTPQFYTQADRAAWEAQGSPSLAPPGTLTQILRVKPFPGSGTAEAPLYRVSHLPTGPGALAQVLAAGKVKDLGVINPQCTNQDCLVFAEAGGLLQGPDIGATPALRSALFKVLANVPGVKDLGTVADHTGQTGTGFMYTERIPAQQVTTSCVKSGAPSATTPSVVTTVPAITITDEIIVDSQTTAVLGTEQRTTPDLIPSVPHTCTATGIAAAAASPRYVTPQWTSLIQEGIVSSDTGLG